MLMLGDGQGPRRLSELSFDLTAAEVERWNSYGKLVNFFGLPRVDIYHPRLWAETSWERH